MGFADHFSAISQTYAAYRPHYPPALIDLLVANCRHGLAWDAGCGSGQLSADLVPHFARVIATDPSAQQIAAAAPGPEYRVEPAEASSLDAHSADLVVAAQAAHWFDWARFVAEVARVAAPGALVGIISYGVPRVPELAAFRRQIGPYWPAGREHVENAYRDLNWPWPAVDVPAMDLVEHWDRDELIGYVGTWSATVRFVAREGTAAVEALADSLPQGRRDIHWPLTVKLARVGAA